MFSLIKFLNFNKMLKSSKNKIIHRDLKPENILVFFFSDLKKYNI